MILRAGFSLSPTECRILSELIGYPRGLRVIELQELAGITRYAAHVLVRRLLLEQRVTRVDHGTYKITRRGRTARQQFAQALGLQP